MEMNYDILFEKKVNNDKLQNEVQQLSPAITAALNCFDEAFLLVDKNLAIAFVNQKANEVIKRISGHYFQPGESVLNLLSGEDQLNLKKILHDALGGKPGLSHFEITRNEEVIYLECNYKPIKDEESIKGAFFMLREVSVTKKSGQKQKERNPTEDRHFQDRALFETFMESTPLTAWITDDKGVIHYANAAFRKVHNLADTGFTRLNDLFPADLVEEYKENNSVALKTGNMIEVVERTLKPDGSMAIYKVFKFPIKVGDETMVGGWSIEITEEAKLQEQLTNSIERYSFVNEATSDAIYDWDISNNMVYRGKGFALLFGYHDPYIPLEFRFARIHPADLAEVKSVYKNALEDVEIKRWKLKYRFKDAKGVYRNVVDKAFIIRENDKVTRVIGAMQDITEYNQLQEKLMIQEESKKRAIVRSIIETQEKERRQLSVELHDNVNQILSSCKLMLEVAKENKEKAQLLTEKSYQSIQLAIDEIRKISHNLNPSAVEDFGLKEAITEMVDKINLSEKLKVVFNFSTSVKKAFLKSEDKIAIYRIVQEQLNNVVKHAHAKNVLVELTVKSSQIHLLIQDDGYGFNPKKVNKGIGLKNIHHRVEYYRGTLAIDTAKNKGCKMMITLNISSSR